MPSAPIDDTTGTWADFRASPRIGVGVIVCFQQRPIISERRFAWLHRAGTTHGNGEWSLPGGRLEYGESLILRAMAEVWEEIGVKEFDAFYRIPFITEDFFPVEKMHWITHYFIAYPKAGEVPKLMEPDKADALEITYAPEGDIFPGAMQAIQYANEHNLWLPNR